MEVTLDNHLPIVQDIRRAKLAEFQRTIYNGMCYTPKHLPSLLLWNSNGLVLFDKFAATDAYYLAKKEMDIIQRYSDDITSSISPGSTIVELGSGNHVKTAIILTNLEKKNIPFNYFALDVNREELERNLLILSQLLSSPSSSVAGLQGIYDDLGPWLETSPLSTCSSDITFLWFGNSIANSTPEEASDTLARLQSSLHLSIQPNVQFLIAVDGCTDPDRLLHSYNPRSAALHAFIFNGLHHANEVLGKTVFKDQDWDLDVRFNANDSVLEVFYKARRSLSLVIDGVTMRVREGERVEAIVSGKWKKDAVVDIASTANLRLMRDLQHWQGDYGKSLSQPSPS